MIKQYDKIKIKEKVNGVECDAYYIITDEDKDMFFVVNEEGKEYYVKYEDEIL